MMKITQYLLLVSYIVATSALYCFDGKTEECPVMSMSYIKIHDEISQIARTARQKIQEIPYARDREEYKRAIKLWLFEEQIALTQELNHEFKTGYLTENIYNGLFEHIFKTIANLVQTIKEA